MTKRTADSRNVAMRFSDKKNDFDNEQQTLVVVGR